MLVKYLVTSPRITETSVALNEARKPLQAVLLFPILIIEKRDMGENALLMCRAICAGRQLHGICESPQDSHVSTINLATGQMYWRESDGDSL